MVRRNSGFLVVKMGYIAVLLIILIPSILFAEGPIQNGYDLYHNIILMDNQKKTPRDVSAGLYTLGYFAGYLDGLVLMQKALYNTVLPHKLLTEKVGDFEVATSGGFSSGHQGIVN